MTELTEITDALAGHWWKEHGMTWNSPDRCSCGAETRPGRGDADISERRGAAVAAHLASVVEPIVNARLAAARAEVARDMRTAAGAFVDATTALHDHQERCTDEDCEGGCPNAARIAEEWLAARRALLTTIGDCRCVGRKGYCADCPSRALLADGGEPQ